MTVVESHENIFDFFNDEYQQQYSFTNNTNYEQEQKEQNFYDSLYFKNNKSNGNLFEEFLKDPELNLEMFI